MTDLRFEIVPVGTHVRFNGGFRGTVTKVCDWREKSGVIMYEVRGDRGACCIGRSDFYIDEPFKVPGITY